MPELPEVETIVRALRPILEGNELLQIEILHPRTIRDTTEKTLKKYTHHTIRSISRRGKYILIEFPTLQPLIIHLRMSGQLLYSNEPLESKHARVKFTLRNGYLTFVDVRTFGTIFPLDGNEPQSFHKLGIEPRSPSFTPELFAELLQNRSTPVKSLLLNQEIIAGIGNIYASESCYLAGIHPERSANSLAMSEVKALHSAVQTVLERAIREMGTTLSDFRRPDGTPGRYGNQLAVYGRTGQPCNRCGTTIERIVQNGRSTFFCPHCQLIHISR